MSNKVITVSSAQVEDLRKAISISSRGSKEVLDSAKGEMPVAAPFTLDFALPALDLLEAKKAWEKLRRIAMEPKPTKVTTKGYRSPGQSAPAKRGRRK